jgi:two-component system, sensor histidine kinase and response regulator
MNLVMGMSNLLLETQQTQEQIEFTSTIKHAANLLMGILGQILDFSKLEVGRMTLSVADFDLRRVVEDVLLVMNSAALEKKLQLSHYIPMVCSLTLTLTLCRA